MREPVLTMSVLCPRIVIAGGDSQTAPTYRMDCRVIEVTSSDRRFVNGGCAYHFGCFEVFELEKMLILLSRSFLDEIDDDCFRSGVGQDAVTRRGAVLTSGKCDETLCRSLAEICLWRLYVCDHESRDTACSRSVEMYLGRRVGSLPESLVAVLN